MPPVDNSLLIGVIQQNASTMEALVQTLEHHDERSCEKFDRQSKHLERIATATEESAGVLTNGLGDQLAEILKYQAEETVRRKAYEAGKHPGGRTLDKKRIKLSILIGAGSWLGIGVINIVIKVLEWLRDTATLTQM